MKRNFVRYLGALLFGSALLGSAPAFAALNIFACEPEWGALAKELAGDKGSIYVATTALQDPHRIEARPSLIARARSADLVVCTGADLEAGWLPLVQSQSGNAKIQTGSPGYFEAARQVSLLEVPQRRRPLAGRRARGRQSARAPRPAQRRESGRCARRAHGGARPRRSCVLPGARERLPRALAAGHRALGEGGGASERHAASSSITATSPTSSTGSVCAKRDPSSPSPGCRPAPRI